MQAISPSVLFYCAVVKKPHAALIRQKLWCNSRPRHQIFFIRSSSIGRAAEFGSAGCRFESYLRSQSISTCLATRVALQRHLMGLYSNINAKKKRIKAGSGERMRKAGSAGAPTAKAFKQSSKTAKKR